tara:strand:- start:2917 stop:3309 length:393 start_codon:yes stop_codon:yes gene_type:complete
MPLNTDLSHGNWDIDLDFGKVGEQALVDLLESDGSIEVKTERDIWKTTGNIAIEIRYYGNPSGISTTEAKTWIHLLSYEGNIEGGFILKVSELKEKIRRLFKRNEAKTVMGGDNNASELVLLPIREMFFI